MEAINKVFTLSKETDSVLSTKIYIKGTSGRTDGTSNYNSVQINGYEWLRAYENLISFAVLSKSGERLYINYTINTSSQGTTTLVDLINAYAEDGNIIILVSSGKISVDTNLQNALQKFGGSDTLTVSSGYCAYYFLGQYGMGSGQAYTGHELGEGKSVYVTASLANGVLQPCGQNGKDSVKYSIDYSTKEAYVDNTNTVTCNIDGQVVKWVGGNKYLVNGAVVKIYPTSNTGYFQEITTTTNTNVGDGYFECIQFNGDNFNKDTTIASSISFTIEVRYAGVLVFTDSLNFTRQGETGKSLYTWIKYSTIYPATKASMTDAKTDTTRYIGIAYNKPSSVESDEPSDYTWTAIKGEDGTSFTAKGKVYNHYESAEEAVNNNPQVTTRYIFDGNSSSQISTVAGVIEVTGSNYTTISASDGDAYVTTIDNHIWVKDGTKWVDLGMIKGDKGDDAVTYEVVFSRRDAYVNSLGKITAGFAGILYKIVGANRTIFTGATFKIGYSDGKGGEGTSYETVSAGIDNVFTNSDNFFDTKDYSSTACNNSKSIYVDVIVNNVTVKTYHETFSFAGDKGDVGGQLETRRHETGFAADYQYYSGTTKVGSLFFLYYVYIVNPDAESGYYVYRCIQDVIYSSIPTDFTTADFKAHWQEISTYDDAYFNYILAKGAYLKFLQSNGIKVMKDDGTTVNVALGGGDYPLWIGSSTYTDAPYKVSKDGKVYASDADVTGCVNAKSGHIGSFAISNETDMIAENSDKTTGMLLSYNLIRFTDDNNGVSVYMGSTTTPSYLPYWKIPLRISNTRTYENQVLPGANLGISLDVSGCKAYDDIVYSGSHSLYIPNGDICGFRKRTRRLKGGTGTSKITLDKLDSNVIIDQNDSIEIVLSHNVEDGQEYFIIVPPCPIYPRNYVRIDANGTNYDFDKSNLKYIKCIFDKVNDKWYIF